jgi:hypothetical protein
MTLEVDQGELAALIKALDLKPVQDDEQTRAFIPRPLRVEDLFSPID